MDNNNYGQINITSEGNDNYAQLYNTIEETPTGNFDVGQFNKRFDNMIRREKIIDKNIDINKLNKLNDIIKQKPIYENSLMEIIYNTKTELFYILDDLLQQNISWNILTKNNRLFYIGITLIILSILFFICYIFSENK
jgi:hypothetical protein